MKVVQINTICGSGSVGRICVDMYETMKKEGIESQIAVGRGNVPPQVKGICIGSKPDFVCHVLKNFFTGKTGFGSYKQTKELVNWLKEQKPDVIHLHNIHGFYIQIEVLFSYLKESRIPVVWTLHDCWPFTGHCAYFDYVPKDKKSKERGSCEKWMDGAAGCNHCPIHASAYPYALFKDNSKWNYAHKKEIFTGVENLTIVTPSYWLKGLVEKSFLKAYPVQVIPNGIDLTKFAPLDAKKQKIWDKQKKGYTNKRVLGVANRWEERKGLSYFIELAKRLGPSYTIELIGLNKAQVQEIKNKYKDLSILPLDRTQDVEMLASIYRTADVYVNATMEDNFPTTNLEALACGTPVVTFETGGSGESVTEKCGIVVPKGDIDALCEAVIKTCHENPFSIGDCRQQAEKYDKYTRFEEYISLYRNIVS